MCILNEIISIINSYELCQSWLCDFSLFFQWMAIEDYMAQPFVRENELFDFLTKIGLSKFDGKYNGFSTVLSSTSSRKKSYFYFNNKDAGHI